MILFGGGFPWQPGFCQKSFWDKAMTRNKKRGNGEVLIAILKDKSDFAILKEQGWYRIPINNRPRRWPPRWLAFYQPQAFDDDAYRIRYYGEVNRIRKYKRADKKCPTTAERS